MRIFGNKRSRRWGASQGTRIPPPPVPTSRQVIPPLDARIVIVPFTVAA